MTNQLYPCLWFENQAKEVADFYCSVFQHSRLISASPLAVKFELEGMVFLGLNGRTSSPINPSISVTVTCQTTLELDTLWEKLIQGGSFLMDVDKYPWSERYGWLRDKYGMTWQLILGEEPTDGTRLMPSFLFVGDQFGKASRAIKLYTTIFPVSQIQVVQHYPPTEELPEGPLMYGAFSLAHYNFSAMDSPGDHGYRFTEAVSLVVECDTQEEIDYYWNSLSAGGQEGKCGWLSDQFGVSWQIIPTVLSQLMADQGKASKAVGAFMKMGKFDIAQLLEAVES